MQNTSIIGWFDKSTLNLKFIVQAGIASFITYLSMYAFRKPFTASTYDHLYLNGINYKIVLILSQLIGYTLSKYIGIKFISELEPRRRTHTLIVLMIFAALMLLLFAITPYPYGFIWMFFNGIPLGMIWGIVFSYIEGRKSTELLGAIMASSFIISSGLVKSVGKYLLDHLGISDSWMPFLTAISFTPILAIGIYLLHHLSPPTQEDKNNRTERFPMDRTKRKQFIIRFSTGIIIAIILYMGLTVFRDIRDNFAIEFWQELGQKGIPELLIFSELPIAFFVLLFIACMILIQNNRIGFYMNLLIIFVGGLLMLVTTVLFMNNAISPLLWMIITGFSMYLPYIAYHTMFFERWIAFFRYQSNAGFLMYMADSFGYLASTLVLLYKNFANPDVSWVSYFVYGSILLGVVIIFLSILLIFYFRKEEKNIVFA